MNRQAQRPTYLFVLPWSLEHLGGVNQVVISLAQEMRKAGRFEPMVLVADWDAVTPVWEHAHGLRAVRWRIRSCLPGAGPLERLVFWFWQLRFRYVFRRFCRQHRVAVVNPHYPGPAVFTLANICQSAGMAIPLLLSFHGADISSLRAAPAEQRAQWRALLLRAPGAVVCSQDLGQKLAEIFGADVLARVVHNGLDLDAFVAHASPAVPARRRSILNVAKFEEKKGQDVLVRAFALIAQDYPDLDLVLVGAADNALPALKALCAQHGLAQRVQFFLNVPHAQVAAFFRQAALFVLPSRAEPFWIVVLEAGAFSLPVVASRVGGVPEILQDGVTGKLVPADDPAALAQCLRLLLDAPMEAQAMGARLHQHVKAEFTWTAAYAKYVALLSDTAAVD